MAVDKRNFYEKGVFGTIGKGVQGLGSLLGFSTAKENREARAKAARDKRSKDLFGQNIAASEEAEKRMGKLEGDMKTKLSLAPSALMRDEAEAGALSLSRANLSGPGSIAAFRDVGLRGHGARARGEADLASSLMAMERGKQTDETQNMIEVSNALNAAREAGALDKSAIARISGMARSKAARDLIQHAQATHKDPKKASLSGDASRILGYLTT